MTKLPLSAMPSVAADPVGQPWTEDGPFDGYRQAIRDQDRQAGVPESSPSVRLLDEAKEILAARGAQYGKVRFNFGRIAQLKAVIEACPDPLVRHVLDEIAVKISRLVEDPAHKDSWLDIAGYAALGYEVTR